MSDHVPYPSAARGRGTESKRRRRAGSAGEGLRPADAGAPRIVIPPESSPDPRAGAEGPGPGDPGWEIFAELDPASLARALSPAERANPNLNPLHPYALFTPGQVAERRAAKGSGPATWLGPAPRR